MPLIITDEEHEQTWNELQTLVPQHEMVLLEKLKSNKRLAFVTLARYKTTSKGTTAASEEGGQSTAAAQARARDSGVGTPPVTWSRPLWSGTGTQARAGGSGGGTLFSQPMWSLSDAQASASKAGVFGNCVTSSLGSSSKAVSVDRVPVKQGPGAVCTVDAEKLLKDFSVMKGDLQKVIADQQEVIKTLQAKIAELTAEDNAALIKRLQARTVELESSCEAKDAIISGLKQANEHHVALIKNVREELNDTFTAYNDLKESMEKAHIGHVQIINMYATSMRTLFIMNPTNVFGPTKDIVVNARDWIMGLFDKGVKQFEKKQHSNMGKMIWYQFAKECMTIPEVPISISYDQKAALTLACGILNPAAIPNDITEKTLPALLDRAGIPCQHVWKYVASIGWVCDRLEGFQKCAEVIRTVVLQHNFQGYYSAGMSDQFGEQIALLQSLGSGL